MGGRTDNLESAKRLSGGLHAIEHADLCLSPADYYGPPALATLNRLLRSFLDAEAITATELIHTYRALKTIAGHGPLVDTATQRIATLQARQPGQSLKERRAALETAFNEAVSRAMKMEAMLVRLGEAADPLTFLLSSGGSPGKSFEQDRLLLAALCQQTIGLKGFQPKIRHLVGLIERAELAPLLPMIDGLLADVMAASTVVHDLFGPQPSLGAALKRLVETATGELEAGVAGTPDATVQLNGSVMAGQLPAVREALLDRVRRQLKSSQPLSRARVEDDVQEFQDLLDMLVTPAGVIGGPGMAEALTVRFARRLDEGGDTGVRLAIRGVADTLQNLFARLQFLTAASSSEVGAKHGKDIAEQMETALDRDQAVEAVLFHPFNPSRLRDQIAKAEAAVAGSGLPRDLREPMRARVRRVIDGYVSRGGLFQRLDRAESNVAKRAQRLIEFSKTGLVHEDGALPMIRQRALDLSKDPSFQEQLVSEAAAKQSAAQQSQAFSALVEQVQEVSVQIGNTMSMGGATMAPGGSGATFSMAPAATPAAARVSARIGTGPRRCTNCFKVKTADGPCPACRHDDSQEGATLGLHLVPGWTLSSRYMVGNLLGQGGFGATYKGWDDRLQVKVAVKEYFPASLVARQPGGTNVIPFSAAQKPTFDEGLVKFLDEARILARLRTVKEIVGVLDYFEENGTAYMIMELLEGRTLQTYMKERGGSIDYKRVLAVAFPVLKAVQAVHGIGLVHRDISPDNIFLTNSKEVKLLDFGAARHSVGEATGSLTVILKRGYAPPEQYAQESRQGPWTDIYAFCATLYTALTGKPPPDAGVRWSEDPLQPPSAMGADVPPALDEILVRGLSMRWQDRPQSVKELYQALARVVG